MPAPARINPMVQRLKNKQLAAPVRRPMGTSSPSRLSDEKRLDNYTRQNGGYFLTARQARQVARTASRNYLLNL